MADLPRRQLGRTGLDVTMLGYGAMELRGAPRGRDVSEDQAETILNAVLDAGINYIDTSIDYGLSEERIGRCISHRRAEYYLASKCGCLVGAPPTPRGQRGAHVFTRDNVVAARSGSASSCGTMPSDFMRALQSHDAGRLTDRRNLWVRCRGAIAAAVHREFAQPVRRHWAVMAPRS